MKLYYAAVVSCVSRYTGVTTQIKLALDYDQLNFGLAYPFKEGKEKALGIAMIIMYTKQNLKNSVQSVMCEIRLNIS